LSSAHRGGVQGVAPAAPKVAREVWLLQRKTSKVGNNLGKTTGWIHRTSLQHRQVKMLPGVNYLRIDDAGFLIEVGGEERLLEVDTVILCAGQDPLRTLQQGLLDAGVSVHLIGGADVA